MKDTMRELMVAELDQVAGGYYNSASVSASQSNSASQSATNSNSGSGSASASNSGSYGVAAASGIGQSIIQDIYQKNSIKTYVS